MPIPQSQKLTLEAKSSLISLVGEEKDFNDQIDWYWKLNNLLGENLNPLICVISRNEIESQDFSVPTNFFARILANSAVARKCQGSVEFCISGYDSDSRSLYEIIEVRHYLQALEPMVRYWFFFLRHHPSSHSLKLLMSCVCGINIISNHISIDVYDRAAFMMRNFAWLNEITEKMNFSLEQEKQISESITEYLLSNYNSNFSG
ncbi:hypothetical protein FJR38_25420 [Anabaena sp. UHCC 0253]|uniref:hypothetical protein n=1 Tax=Anabaena sp. UHCC 0253 TaxID=2590019 RepID=UPI0014468570|nr:hypothetical protein [Anabaena sp. UHCC 0253]MTJ55765.1 hypothetical protein [Anabaena sp. UHCC 0253]